MSGAPCEAGGVAAHIHLVMPGLYREAENWLELVMSERSA
jgi:hypothetical protein